MSYEFWIEAEKFLYDSFFINLIILGFAFTLIINSLSFIGYDNSKASKIILSIVTILFIAFGINTVTKFNKYKILYDYDRYANYGVRSYKKTIITYQYPDRTQEKLYDTLFLIDSFRKVSIYDEEKIIENVEFLGRDGDNFYFQDQDSIYYRKLGNCLEIIDDISLPIREGVRFHLKDLRFKNIGFKEKSSYTYLLTYKIPKSLENKIFENLEDIKIMEQGGFTLGWINPTSANKLPTAKINQ
ncbi:hypothetical protein [Tissierella sp.]|uniref:hypothetical protein n=1 Tax=Tissierella sp. TaxID=41274 RepID=UPI00285B3B35|nr:hypothetical protein [Tissierella sp.]MDR7856826.1 hypothetical protein [Tissierella sp.]